MLDYVLDPHGKYTKVDSIRIVADTAWATVIDWRDHLDLTDTVSHGDTMTIRKSLAAYPRGIRLERRRGRWVVVAYDPPPARYDVAPPMKKPR